MSDDRCFMSDRQGGFRLQVYNPEKKREGNLPSPVKCPLRAYCFELFGSRFV